MAETPTIIPCFVLNLSGSDLLTVTSFLAQLRSARVLLPLMLILVFTGFLYTVLPVYWFSLHQVIVAEDPTSPCIGADGFAPVMALLPAGSLNVGEADAKGSVDGQQIYVDAFAVSRCEVTYDDYHRYVKVATDDPSILEDDKPDMPSDYGWGMGMRPLIAEDWTEATAYAKGLTTLTGKAYSLPTEAQWEYAARAGTSSDFYTGDCITEDDAVFDSTEPYNECPVGVAVPDRTALVATKAPNPWKLYDMLGNVWEWSCSEYLDVVSTECATNDFELTNVVLRGGEWASRPDRLRFASRLSFELSENLYFTAGIRLARAVP